MSLFGGSPMKLPNYQDTYRLGFEVDSIGTNSTAFDDVLKVLQERGYTRACNTPNLVYGKYLSNATLRTLKWRLSLYDIWQKCLTDDENGLLRYKDYLNNGILNIVDHPPAEWFWDKGKLRHLADEEIEFLQRMFTKHPNPLAASDDYFDRRYKVKKEWNPSRLPNYKRGVEGCEYDDDPSFWYHVNMEQARRRARVGVVGRTGKEAISDLDRVSKEFRLR